MPFPGERPLGGSTKYRVHKPYVILQASVLAILTAIDQTFACESVFVLSPPSQGRDGLLHTWDLDTLSETSHPISSAQVHCVGFCKFTTFSCEGKTLALGPGADSGSICVIDLAESKTIRTISPFDSITASKLGMCMCLRVFNEPTPPTVATTAGSAEEREELGAAATTSGRTLIACGFENGHLYLIDFVMGTLCVDIAAHAEPVTCVDIGMPTQSNHTVQLITGSADSSIRVWTIDLLTMAHSQRSEFPLKHPGVGDVKIRPDQKIVATGGWDHRVRIFNWKKCEPLAILKFHTETVTAIDFSIDNCLLASGSQDKRIALWSIYPPKC